MSSISSSDRSRQQDEIRSNREEYNNREAEQAKKHKREIRRITENFDQKVQELKENYSKQIEGLKEKSSDTFGRRDQKYSKDIENLRSMYTENLRKKAEEAESKRLAQDSTSTNELDKERNINRQQRELLKKEFDASHQEQEKNFFEYAEQSRDGMRKAIETQARKLNEKFNKELKALVQDRDQKVMSLTNHNDETARALKTQLKDQKRQSDNKIAQTNENWMTVYNTSQKETDTVLSARDKILQSEKENLRKRYAEELNKKVKDFDNYRDRLKEQSIGYMEKRVRSAELKAAEAKHEYNANQVKGQRLTNLELKNVKRAYDDRFKDLNFQKEAITDVVNDKARSRVNDVIDRSDKMLSDTSRKHKLEQNIMLTRNRQDRNQLISNYEGEIDYVKNNTEDRIGKIMKTTTETQSLQEKMHRKSIDNLKNVQADRLADQRIAQIDVIKDQYLKMEKKLRDQERKNQTKYSTTIDQYEKEIAIKDEVHKNEIKRQQDLFQQKSEVREKAVEQTLESQEMKFQNKMAQLHDAHQKDLDRIEKKHQEQMQALSGKINYYSRKG